jgi:hypothetical protein
VSCKDKKFKLFTFAIVVSRHLSVVSESEEGQFLGVKIR